MSGPFLVIALLAVVALAVMLGWVIRSARRRSRSIVIDDQALPGLARLRDATLRARRIAVAAGVLVAVALFWGAFASGLEFTGPAVAGLLCVGVIWAGQRSAYAAARTPGVAGLERRRLGDYLPRGLAAWIAVALGVLGVAAVTTSALASPDDRGRLRALAYACVGTIYHGDGSVETTTGSGALTPFPGSYYTVPAAVAVALLLVASAAVLVSVVRRPRNGSDPALVAVDDAVRRITAEGVVASAGLGIAGSLVLVAGVAFPRLGAAVSGCGINGMDTVNSGAYLAGSYGLFAACLVGLVVGLRSLVVLAIPSDGGRR